jgi:hypothetical protein
MRKNVGEQVFETETLRTDRFGNKDLMELPACRDGECALQQDTGGIRTGNKKIRGIRTFKGPPEDGIARGQERAPVGKRFGC